MASGKTAGELIDEGLAVHKAGDVKKARSLFEAALQAAPDHPEALHLLGLTCEQEGDRAQALKLIGRAVEVDPDEPAFRLNLAALMEQESRFRGAVEHLRAAAAKVPSDVNIGLRLARALFKAGAYSDACEAAMKLARASAAPNIAALTIAAAAAFQTRNWRMAIEAAETWRRAEPANPQPARFLAGAWFELGDTSKARDIFRSVAEKPGAAADDLIAFGRYCIASFDYRTARTALERAQKMAPASAMAAFALSRLGLFEGELEESERQCLQAIEADPSLAPAYAHLVRLKNGDVDEAYFAPMRRLAESAAIPAEHRAALYHALGEAFHRQGRYEDASAAFEKGNGVTEDLFRLEGCAYDARASEQARARDISLFSGTGAASFEQTAASPIFIVGMPRSGTTLIESVLAAHPDVFGAGELTSMPAIGASVQQWMRQAGATSLADLPEDRLREWRKQYIESWPDIGDARHVADKQPANFRSVGLIRALFPNAPIVHVRRNPVETGFSIYRHDFSKAWPYATKLTSIAHYYGEYARMMAHWEAALDMAASLFQYEGFVDSFADEARRLIAHCGLDWSDACLSFHENKRPVATFSAAQVRRPVEKKSSSAVEQYGDFLKPLIEGLKEAGVDLETGALTPGKQA